jgi:CO/xanthine dehydrogenase Mo-binding subunit
MTNLSEPIKERTFSRRAFVKGGGALVVAFGLPLSLTGTATGDSVPYPVVDASQLDSWLSIGQDGKVTVFTGRVDSGQHKQTSFGQIVADELDVPFESIHMVMGDTGRVVNQGASTASDGLLLGSRPLRHAAAEARRVLLNLAAAKFGVAASQLSVSDGVVSLTANPSQKVSYGELIGNQRFNTTVKVTGSGSNVDVQGQTPIKDPSKYKVIGKSIPSVTIPDKVTATWPRIHNIRVPGMVHARVVMPPSVGAHLVSVDGFTQKVPGLVKVVAKGDFLAVVAETEWGAIQALQSIKTTWNETPSLSGNGDVFKYLRTAPVSRVSNTVSPIGNVDTALAGAAKTFSADYNYPVQMHGMIGPSCAVADVRGNQATIWSGTQSPFGAQAATASMLGIPTTSVRVFTAESSGAYGRLGTDDSVPMAAYISQQVGRPVRLQWMRQQEHAWSPQFPASAFTYRAGVDATGKITAWDQQEWSWATNSLELPLQLGARAGLDVTGKTPGYKPPGGGEVSTYVFDNMRVLGNTVAPQLRGAAMRSPSRIQANFSGEQFLDEIASATGQDPIAIRLRHLADNTDPYTLASIKPRMTAVLQAVQQASGWQTRPSPSSDATSGKRVVRGRGISIVASQRSAYVANVAEVEVDRKTGKVTVTKMTVAVDAAQIVNPLAIKAQIEGATLYATSRALKEQVTFTKEKITDVDWVTYPILRFVDVPDIEITLLDRPDLAVNGSFANGGVGTYVNSGIGEPPNTVVPAAIGNAIFDATGVRIRELPFTPVRVRAALKAAGVVA